MKNNSSILSLSYWLIASAIFLFSCTAIITRIYGAKRLRNVQTEDIIKHATRFGIPPESSFELDTALYLAFLNSIDSSKYATELKDHMQPLQVIYYNRAGFPICWYINCYAGGIPNLKWDRDSAFAQFPPKQQTPLDSLLLFEKLYSMINPVHDSVKPPLSPSANTFVVVFWDRWMGRQSERLIELVQQNAMKQDAQLIYVNNDNLFAALLQ